MNNSLQNEANQWLLTFSFTIVSLFTAERLHPPHSWRNASLLWDRVASSWGCSRRRRRTPRCRCWSRWSCWCSPPRTVHCQDASPPLYIPPEQQGNNQVSFLILTFLLISTSEKPPKVDDAKLLLIPKFSLGNKGNKSVLPVSPWQVPWCHRPTHSDAGSSLSAWSAEKTFEDKNSGDGNAKVQIESWLKLFKLTLHFTHLMIFLIFASQKAPRYLALTSVPSGKTIGSSACKSNAHHSNGWVMVKHRVIRNNHESPHQKDNSCELMQMWQCVQTELRECIWIKVMQLSFAIRRYVGTPSTGSDLRPFAQIPTDQRGIIPVVQFANCEVNSLTVGIYAWMERT